MKKKVERDIKNLAKLFVRAFAMDSDDIMWMVHVLEEKAKTGHPSYAGEDSLKIIRELQNLTLQPSVDSGNTDDSTVIIFDNTGGAADEQG